MLQGWTTADYALIISLCSLLLAVASFVWNVWSRFIFPKPKVKVWLDLQYLNTENQHSASIRPDGTFAGDFDPRLMALPCISLTTTNFGPGELTVTSAAIKLARKHPRRKEGHGLVIAYNDYPNDLSARGVSSGGLPRKLQVGDQMSLHYPVEDFWFESNSMAKIGIVDSFGRFHWSTMSNVKRLRKQFEAHKKNGESDVQTI